MLKATFSSSMFSTKNDFSNSVQLKMITISTVSGTQEAIKKWLF